MNLDVDVQLGHDPRERTVFRTIGCGKPFFPVFGRLIGCVSVIRIPTRTTTRTLPASAACGLPLPLVLCYPYHEGYSCTLAIKIAAMVLRKDKPRRRRKGSLCKFICKLLLIVGCMVPVVVVTSFGFHFLFVEHQIDSLSEKLITLLTAADHLPLLDDFKDHPPPLEFLNELRQCRELAKGDRDQVDSLRKQVDTLLMKLDILEKKMGHKFPDLLGSVSGMGGCDSTFLRDIRLDQSFEFGAGGGGGKNTETESFNLRQRMLANSPTTANQRQLHQGTPLSELPGNFRRAASMPAALGQSEHMIIGGETTASASGNRLGSSFFANWVARPLARSNRPRPGDGNHGQLPPPTENSPVSMKHVDSFRFAPGQQRPGGPRTSTHHRERDGPPPRRPTTSRPSSPTARSNQPSRNSSMDSIASGDGGGGLGSSRDHDVAQMMITSSKDRGRGASRTSVSAAPQQQAQGSQSPRQDRFGALPAGDESSTAGAEPQAQAAQPQPVPEAAQPAAAKAPARQRSWW